MRYATTLFEWPISPMIRKIHLLLSAFLGLAPLVAQAGITTEATLANGLQVVIREDHRAPVIVVEVAYKVGAVDEKDGKTGLAHMLEHLMFKGTEQVPSEEFSRIVAHFGGEDNAFTTDDYTAYYQMYAADRLPLALELEADRMQHLQISDADFVQEHRVVMEERRWRIDDQPMALASEHFAAVAHMSSPYRRPTIGWMPDIQGLTAADARDWYHRWYAPNNAVLVIVGDVQSAAAMAAVHHYFDAVPAHSVPAHIVPREAEVPGLRELKMSLPKVKVPSLMRAYTVPGLLTVSHAEDVYALTMLAGILDEGDSSRLEQDLVRRQQVAAAINVGYDALARGDTLFEIDAVPAAGHTLADVRQALQTEIEKIQQTPPSQAELQRVQAQLVAGEVYSHDSVGAIAGELVHFLALGLSWKDSDEYTRHLQAVTPQQVQDVARRYLVPAEMSVANIEGAH